VVDGDSKNNSSSASFEVVVLNIAVIGNNQVIANGSGSPATGNDTDFGSALVSLGAVTRTFTISNNGQSQLQLTGSPAVSLTRGTPFTVTSQPAGPVGPGASATFQIVFAPTSAGVFSDTVIIANNSVDDNPYTFVIGGRSADNTYYLPLLQKDD
jgi:hypothetical protein